MANYSRWDDIKQKRPGPDTWRDLVVLDLTHTQGGTHA